MSTQRNMIAAMRNHSIRMLDFYYQGLADAELEPFCAALVENTSVTDINLHNNSISHMGAAALARALALNTSVVHVPASVLLCFPGMLHSLLSETRFQVNMTNNPCTNQYRSRAESADDDAVLQLIRDAVQVR